MFFDKHAIFIKYFTGIEEKDDRSIFDDFREFEEDYAGKKSTKLFKNQWKEYLHNRDCMIGYEGLFRYGYLINTSRDQSSAWFIQYPSLTFSSSVSHPHIYCPLFQQNPFHSTNPLHLLYITLYPPLFPPCYLISSIAA